MRTWRGEILAVWNYATFGFVWNDRGIEKKRNEQAELLACLAVKFGSSRISRRFNVVLEEISNDRVSLTCVA